MPTAARLTAALVLVMAGLAAVYFVLPLLPDSQPRDLLYPITLGFAAVVGWMFIGGRAGDGIVNAAFNGLTGGFLWTLATLFAFGVGRMWQLAFRRQYQDPFDAVLAVFEETVLYGQYVLNYNVLLSVAIGALLAGILAELADKRFP